MSVTLKFDTAAWKADMRRVDRTTNRATMWGLREIGRQLKRAEKRRAPVYKPGAKMLKRKAIGPMQKGPVRGLLKASIGSARSFKRRGPGDYTLVVGPRGGRVNLYKNKIERATHFAQDAYDEVVPQAPAIMVTAWGRALRSKR